MAWDVIVGYASGLLLVAPHLEGSALARTLLVVHLCHAACCGVFAHNKGYGRGVWSAAGFVLGVWALAVVIALPARPASRPRQ